MTYKELVDRALDRAGLSASNRNSENRTRFEGFVNDAHREVLADPLFARLRNRTMQFASVANQQDYGLPPAIARINRIYETTNNNRLIAKDLNWLRQRPQQGVATTGTPQYYIPVGERPILRFPAVTGAGLWVASSAAADTTQKVRVSGIRVNGYKYEPLLTTLNGTTRVAIGTPSA